MAINIVAGCFAIPSNAQVDHQTFHSALHKDLLNCNIKFYMPIGIKANANNSGNISILDKLNGIGKSYAELMAVSNELIFMPPNKDSYIQLYGTGMTTSDNMYFEQQGMNAICPGLLKGVTVANTLASCGISLHAHLAAGSLSFEMAQRKLKSTEHYAVSANYDLSHYIVLKPYTQKDIIEFMYKREINESVLSNIINYWVTWKGLV